MTNVYAVLPTVFTAGNMFLRELAQTGGSRCVYLGHWCAVSADGETVQAQFYKEEYVVYPVRLLWYSTGRDMDMKVVQILFHHLSCGRLQYTARFHF